MPYSTGSWDATKFGNHRAVVHVESAADAVCVRILWRRRDENPEKKNVVVIDAATGTRVKNVCPLAINRESGDFVFQPATVPGDYYFYYLTNASKGNPHYPTVTYDPPEKTADEAWLKRWGQSPLVGLSPSPTIPEARLVEIQSIDEFNSFYPMEVIATAEETTRLLAAHPDALYLLFPEGRRFSVRMKDDLPQRWIESGPRTEFSGEALRGEFFTFQIGVFACRKAIESIEVAFEDLTRNQTAVPPHFDPLPSGGRGSQGALPARNPLLGSDKPPSVAQAKDTAASEEKSKTNTADSLQSASGRSEKKAAGSISSGGPERNPAVIPASGMHSFNTRGVNWDGKPFVKSCAVPLGKVQPLWCGVQVPKDALLGTYETEIAITPKGLSPTRVKLLLNVKDAVLAAADDTGSAGKPRLPASPGGSKPGRMPSFLADAGDSEPSRMSRLRWLDSRIAFDDEIVPPFTPLRVDGRTVSCLGRNLTLGDNGLPEEIRSFYTPEVTGIGATGREVLSSPIAFAVYDAEGNILPRTPGQFEFTKQTPGAVSWRAESQAGSLALMVLGTMEFDGFVEFKVEISQIAGGALSSASHPPAKETILSSRGSDAIKTARPFESVESNNETRLPRLSSAEAFSPTPAPSPQIALLLAPAPSLASASEAIKSPPASAVLEVSDIRLEIPLARDSARYMMGLGYKGGLRPAEFAWTWDRTRNQDALWLGDVNAGVQVSLRDENYSRPLNTNFYLSKPLNLPPSWWNNGEGICAVQETSASTVLFTASSGPRRIVPSDTLHFNFNLLLTPFKPIDPRSQFSTRFFHAFKPIDEVVRTGANTINVHHATAINPYINYPFLRPAEMKAYIDEAHARGLKVKIYYTIRELSNRAPELFALRSLGDEIFSRGPGGGFSWLQEHLGSDYIPAWFVPELKDAAVINSGLSRWHNYYLEGLDWLVRNVGIDGLYIDDVAFDRTTMKRVRKILDRGRPGALIDLHSANQFNPRDGFASSANLYLEHFPYLNRLWFGEYFDYNSAPAYWLVEISGIPFGLMGEMLQDGGNPWRGMVFGMTNRLPWSGHDPSRLWRVWDEFGIGDAEMVGWWSPDCPVRTDSPDVLATAYLRKGGASAGADAQPAGDVSGGASGAATGGPSTMIALASWAKERISVRLDIDWKALGLNEAEAAITAPAIPDFQPEAAFRPGDQIPIDPGMGWILVLKK